jgi:hypothetical protein
VGATETGLGLAAGAASAGVGGSLANAILVSSMEAAKEAKREILVSLVIVVITAFLIIVFIFYGDKTIMKMLLGFINGRFFGYNLFWHYL